MELGCIRPGMMAEVIHIPPSMLKERLRQFGLVEGTVVRCRYARRRLLALEWMGTAVAVRRKDLSGFEARVIPCGN